MKGPGIPLVLLTLLKGSCINKMLSTCKKCNKQFVFLTNQFKFHLFVSYSLVHHIISTVYCSIGGPHKLCDCILNLEEMYGKIENPCIIVLDCDENTVTQFVWAPCVLFMQHFVTIVIMKSKYFF